jgi:hypothetical protein
MTEETADNVKARLNAALNELAAATGTKLVCYGKDDKQIALGSPAGEQEEVPNSQKKKLLQDLTWVLSEINDYKDQPPIENIVVNNETKVTVPARLEGGEGWIDMASNLAASLGITLEEEKTASPVKKPTVKVLSKDQKLIAQLHNENATIKEQAETDFQAFQTEVTGYLQHVEAKVFEGIGDAQHDLIAGIKVKCEKDTAIAGLVDAIENKPQMKSDTVSRHIAGLQKVMGSEATVISSIMGYAKMLGTMRSIASHEFENGIKAEAHSDATYLDSINELEEQAKDELKDRHPSVKAAFTAMYDLLKQDKEVTSDALQTAYDEAAGKAGDGGKSSSIKTIIAGGKGRTGGDKTP